jgi:ABC-type tungstate transport system substrate-binding protein
MVGRITYQANSLLPIGRRTWFMSVLSIMGLGAAFSSLHIVAWNWEFPSLVEQTLRRVSSLAATAACVLVGALLPFMGTGGKWWQKWTVNIIVQPLWAMYMVARGVLLVQVVICMRRMPAGVYQDVNWTSYIPHAS